jgi:hypothetical protein
MGGSCCGVVHEVVVVGPPVHRWVSPCYEPGVRGAKTSFSIASADYQAMP